MTDTATSPPMVSPVVVDIGLAAFALLMIEFVPGVHVNDLNLVGLAVFAGPALLAILLRRRALWVAVVLAVAGRLLHRHDFDHCTLSAAYGHRASDGNASRARCSHPWRC